MFILKEVKYINIIDINELTIPQNKITCVVGKSGSGKTTLIRLLNKLISYTSGEIYYKSEILSKLDSINLRREVTMMSQTPVIFSGTIRDNLLIGLQFSHKPLVNDDKLINILKFVHLNKQLDDNAEKLSGGERQRLSLGRVLLLEPEVLLLDEPSSALDDNTEQLVIEQVVRYIKENNKTLIMVTHSKAIAKQYADYIIEMADGKVINKEVKV